MGTHLCCTDKCLFFEYNLLESDCPLCQASRNIAKFRLLSFNSKKGTFECNQCHKAFTIEIDSLYPFLKENIEELMKNFT